MKESEKAEDLFCKFLNDGMKQIKPTINRVIRKEMVKQCALIAVDEILKVSMDNLYSERYWQEVKQEIELL
jgi:hypothetical protein